MSDLVRIALKAMKSALDEDNGGFPAGVIDPDREPVRARQAVARYEKAKRRGQKCPRCLKEPRDPLIGKCGFCFYDGKDAAQNVPKDEMCGDCAFRKGSPEQKSGVLQGMLDDPFAIDTPFYCHKPFLEPRQRWGIEHNRIVLIKGEHWKLCGGWCKAVADPFISRSLAGLE